MKITKKNVNSALRFSFLVGIVGTITWAIFELLLEQMGIDFSLSLGPLGFDLEFIQFYIKLNPGTLLGIIGGWIFFSRL